MEAAEEKETAALRAGERGGEAADTLPFLSFFPWTTQPCSCATFLKPSYAQGPKMKWE